MQAQEKTGAKYKDVIKVADSPLTYFFAGRWANRLLPFAYERGFTPNQVTAASLALACLVALCFAHGSRLVAFLGSVILIVSFILDCLDGQLARYTGNSTPFGFWLDVFGDRVRELVLWICLCIGFSTRTGDMEVWKWGMLAAIALCLRFVAGLYRGKALNRVPIQPPLSPDDPVQRRGPLTIGDGEKVSVRVWIQRLFYFSIAERTFLLAFAAPLGLTIVFFKVVGVACFIMMIVFTGYGWYSDRDRMFVKINKE